MINSSGGNLCGLPVTWRIALCWLLASSARFIFESPAFMKAASHQQKGGCKQADIITAARIWNRRGLNLLHPTRNYASCGASNGKPVCLFLLEPSHDLHSLGSEVLIGIFLAPVRFRVIGFLESAESRSDTLGTHKKHFLRRFSQIITIYCVFLFYLFIYVSPFNTVKCTKYAYRYPFFKWLMHFLFSNNDLRISCF